MDDAAAAAGQARRVLHDRAVLEPLGRCVHLYEYAMYPLPARSSSAFNAPGFSLGRDVVVESERELVIWMQYIY